MREIRTSGSEGGVAHTRHSYSYLFKPHAIPSVEATILYKNFRTLSLDFLFFQKDFWKTNLQVIGIQSLVKLIQMIVVPLQGTVFG